MATIVSASPAQRTRSGAGAGSDMRHRLSAPTRGCDPVKAGLRLSCADTGRSSTVRYKGVRQASESFRSRNSQFESAAEGMCFWLPHRLS
jgi:hypothetical protein